jgi:hypothetical protein
MYENFTSLVTASSGSSNLNRKRPYSPDFWRIIARIAYLGNKETGAILPFFWKTA